MYGDLPASLLVSLLPPSSFYIPRPLSFIPRLLNALVSPTLLHQVERQKNMANKVDLTAFVSEQTPAQPKRIVICCDGSWQSSVSLDPKKGVESNVTRIARVLAKAGTDKNGKEWEQVVYYDAGVGAGKGSLLNGSIQGKWPPFL